MPSTVPTYLAEVFVREQATYDTFERFDQYDAVSPVKGSLELEPIRGLSEHNEDVGSASYQGATLTNKGVACKGQFKIRPHDMADLDTDLHQYNDAGGTVHVKVFDASDGPGYDDLNNSSSLTAWTSNYQLLPDAASEAAGDGFMVGHDKPFSRIEFNDLATGNGSVATWGGDGGKYQYSTGQGTWSDLTVADTTDTDAGDGLRTLQQAGTITFTTPADWARATYDSQEAFWIRYVITAAQLTQTAIIDDTNKDEPFVISADQMAPDIRCLLRAAFGHEEIQGITQTAYKLTDTVVPDGLQVVKHFEGLLQETGSGLMVSDWEFNLVGNEDPTFDFTLSGARYGRIARDVVGSGGIATGVASCPLNDASRGAVIEPVCCQIGDDDNTTGYLVTAHDDTAGSADFTISPVLAGAGEDAGQEIKPFAPSRSVGGSVLTGVNATLTIDSVTLGVVSFKLKGNSGAMLRDKEASSDRANGIARGPMRVIEGEIQAYLLTNATGNAPIAGQAFDRHVHDIDLTVGDGGAGNQMKISIPAGEGRVNKLEHTQNEVTMVTLLFRAKQSSVAGDECVVTFD